MIPFGPGFLFHLEFSRFRCIFALHSFPHWKGKQHWDQLPAQKILYIVAQGKRAFHGTR